MDTCCTLSHLKVCIVSLRYLIPDTALLQLWARSLIILSVHAAISANTFAIYGTGQVKELTELVPGILNQLGPDSLASLRKLAESYQAIQQGQQRPSGAEGADEDDDDDVPDLVENFDVEAEAEQAEPAEPTEEKPEAEAEVKAESGVEELN